jgi:hypothetical protein
VNEVPGRYLPVKDEIVWARWDVLRAYRRAVVTELRPGLSRANRTAVHFIWLEDDLDGVPKIEAGTYGHLTVPTADFGEPFPDLVQPYAPGQPPLIRLEKDWRLDIPSLPADGLLLSKHHAARRIGVAPETFRIISASGYGRDDFPLAYYSFEHRKMWRASDLDEWRSRHAWPPLTNPNSRSTRNPNGPRAMAAKKRGGPGSGASR